MTSMITAYTVTFRDGRVKSYKTWTGAVNARRPGCVITRCDGKVMEFLAIRNHFGAAHLKGKA